MACAGTWVLSLYFVVAHNWPRFWLFWNNKLGPLKQAAKRMWRGSLLNCGSPSQLGSLCKVDGRWFGPSEEAVLVLELVSPRQCRGGKPRQKTRAAVYLVEKRPARAAGAPHNERQSSGDWTPPAGPWAPFPISAGITRASKVDAKC